MRYLSIPLIMRRDGQYYLRVVDSDGASTRASWVGPFPDTAEIVRWIEQYALETARSDFLSPLDIGLPAELAFLRPAPEQARAARIALARLHVVEEES